MKKSSVLDYVVLGALFILLSVALLLVPNEKKAGFWIAYGFTAVSFLAQFYIVNRSKGNTAIVHTKILGLPLLQLGMLYAVVQIIILAAFAVVPNLPVWISIVGCIIVLLFFGYFILTADYPSKEDTEEFDPEANYHADKDKLFSLDLIYDDIKKCSEGSCDEDTKEFIRSLCKKVNLCSSVRSVDTQTIENRIQLKVASLKTASDKKILLEEISALLDEREEICRKL